MKKRTIKRILQIFGVFYLTTCFYTLMWILIRLFDEDVYLINNLKMDILRAVPLAIVFTLFIYFIFNKYKLKSEE